MDLAHFYFQDVKQEISPYSGHRGDWHMKYGWKEGYLTQTQKNEKNSIFTKMDLAYF